MRRILILAALAAALSLSCSTNRTLREHLGTLAGKREVVVVMYGDELSSGGNPFDIANSWGSMLKPRLSELLGGARISFINSSREGESYGTASRRMQEDILSFRPDIVFIMLGRVDAYTSGLTQSVLRKNIESFLGDLSEEGKFVVVLTTPGLRSFPYAGAEDIAWFENINQETRYGAQLYRFPLIDIGAKMKQIMIQNPDEYESFFSDNMYLSEKGKQYIADFVFQKFKSVLKDMPAPAASR